MSVDTGMLFVIVIGLGWLVFSNAAKGYGTEKGKNLATREDIADITRQIEAVKTDYAKHVKDLEHSNALLLEAVKVQNSLRTAVAEKRLEAHQQAFTLWRKLQRFLYDEDQLPAVTLECQDWWEKNCLYLSSEARNAFNLAYHGARTHRLLVETRAEVDAIKASAATFNAAADAILRGAELPPLGHLAQRDLTTPDKDGPQPS